MSRKVVLFNGIKKKFIYKYIYAESYANAEMQIDVFEIFPRVFLY